jgi:ParB-like chromosome segregation protein Spo0J
MYEIAVHCTHRTMVDVTELRPHPNNPNRHSDEQVALLAKNIRALGWRHPVIVSERSGYIVAGHARVLAAGVLGVVSVPVDTQPFASEAEELSYLVADNRLAELAERDNAVIKDLLETLDDGSTDMDLTGYSQAAIENLMTQVHVDPEPETPSVCPTCGQKVKFHA